MTVKISHMCLRHLEKLIYWCQQLTIVETSFCHRQQPSRMFCYQMLKKEAANFDQLESSVR